MAVRQYVKHMKRAWISYDSCGASIEERKNGRYSIIITEVPYGMSKEGFVDQVRGNHPLITRTDARDRSAAVVRFSCC